MRHEVEALASITKPRGAPEIVDGHRIDAGLGETLRQLFVEVMQAAHVRHHDHAGAGRLRRSREIGGELRAVARREHEVPLVGGSATYRWKGWTGIVSMAHGSILA